MTAEEKRTEAIWTYMISKERIFRRLVDKGIVSQDNADYFLDLMYDDIDLDKIPGARITPLGEKMRSPDPCMNPYISLTDIAKEKSTASPGYLIQSWLRSSNTTDYLKCWEKKNNLKFWEDECDELIKKVHSTSLTLTPTLWITSTNAIGIKTSRGKGGGTKAHPEIAMMFRAWLFPEFMMELVRFYRNFQHSDSEGTS